MLLSSYMIIVGFLAIIAQMFFPSWSIFFEMEPHLPVLIIIFACFILQGNWAFFVATVLGIGLDLLSPQKIGLSSISLIITTALMLTQRRTIQSERWGNRILLIIAGTYFFLMIDYLLYSLQLQRWMWPSSLWYRMLFPAFFNAVLSLVLYPIITRFAIYWGWYEPRHFSEEYART